MIQLTRIIDQSVIDKVDTTLLKEHLPELDRDICIIFCATQHERKEDTWEKDGKLFLQIVLDYSQVKQSTTSEVVELMKQMALDRLNQS